MAANFIIVVILSVQFERYFVVECAAFAFFFFLFLNLVKHIIFLDRSIGPHSLRVFWDNLFHFSIKHKGSS